MSNHSAAKDTLFSIASGTKGASVVVIVAAAVLTYAWFGPSVTDRPYSGFPLIGKEDVKTTQEAKQKWLRSAKSLIYDTLARVGQRKPLNISIANYLIDRSSIPSARQYWPINYLTRQFYG
jgi:hypothetical protein